MAISVRTKRAARLLAKAYIYAMGNDSELAGDTLVAACRGGALDEIMAGVAKSMGYDDEEEGYEDDYDDDAKEMEIDSEAEDEDDEENMDDEDTDDEDDEDTDDEDDEEGVKVPAACARLAGMTY